MFKTLRAVALSYWVVEIIWNFFTTVRHRRKPKCENVNSFQRFFNDVQENKLPVPYRFELWRFEPDIVGTAIEPNQIFNRQSDENNNNNTYHYNNWRVSKYCYEFTVYAVIYNIEYLRLILYAAATLDISISVYLNVIVTDHNYYYYKCNNIVMPNCAVRLAVGNRHVACDKIWRVRGTTILL